MGLGISSILIYLYIGIGFSGLINLMHETCHSHVFRNKKANQILGNWILGPLFFADFESYKLRHWDHHKFLGKEGETKLTYFIDISGTKFLMFLIKGLLLIEMIKKIRNLFKAREISEKRKKRNIAFIGRILLFQGVFFMSLAAVAFVSTNGNIIGAMVNSFYSYFLYFYGLTSLTIIVTSLRAIAEHKINIKQNALEGDAALRNFRCNSFSRFVFGSYGFGEHLTHHMLPAIPYYNLSIATKELNKKDKLYSLGSGYFKTLFFMIRKGKT